MRGDVRCILWGEGEGRGQTGGISFTWCYVHEQQRAVVKLRVGNMNKQGKVVKDEIGWEETE